MGVVFRAHDTELVEGETLAQKQKRSSLPQDEALHIAKQILDALEAAHEKGIVHRDLKPGNVMVLPDGNVKVLDFGLAKAFEGAPSGAGLSHSPTLSMAATQAGVILGTAAYMSMYSSWPSISRAHLLTPCSKWVYRRNCL